MIPPPPRIVTRASSRFRPAGPDHVVAAAYWPMLRSPATAERQRHLGDRLGVDAFAARPRVLVVEVVDEVLDPGERQLDPPQVRRLIDRLTERIGIARVAPHDRFALVESDEVTSSVADRLLEPFRRAGGAEGDGERITIRHVPANRSVADRRSPDR